MIAPAPIDQTGGIAGKAVPTRCVLLLSVLPCMVSAATAADTTFSDFPFMVHCRHDQIDRAFYLSKIGPDGVAIYISPDRQAGIITIDGPAKPLGGEWSGICSGKTIKQLRTDGQAFDLRK